MGRLKILLMVLSVCIISNTVHALQIVYPKSDNAAINSESTFFAGNESPDKHLEINSEQVKIHPSGGFFHPVKLNIGENLFNITDGEETQTYKITRLVHEAAAGPPGIITYQSPEIYLTDYEGTPLRATPIDAGLNRLQHLERGIELNIIGEYGDFYKVRLARDDYAWVRKSHVKKVSKYDNKPAKTEGFLYEQLPDKRIFIFRLNKKVPYILYENNGLDLTVYNVEGFFENKYEFHINQTGAMFGYKSYYNDNYNLVVEVKNFPQVDKQNPLKGLKIMIDPGHGGDEYGAIGCLGGSEKDINLAISLKLKSLLEDTGANVLMTRDDDRTVSLEARAAGSKSADADLFISIHNNALPDSAAGSIRSGTSVYYFYNQSKSLGKSVLDSMVKELGMKNDGLKAESFAVIRNTESPAILIEAGYMIMPDDNAKLVNPEFQYNAARAIKQGLENYLNDFQ